MCRKTMVLFGVLGGLAGYESSASAECHALGEPHHKLEFGVSLGATAWLSHIPEATFGLVMGMPIDNAGCWIARGAVELYKPIGIQPAGIAGVLSVTRRLHRTSELGLAATVLLPFIDEAYHHPEGAGFAPREGVILAAGPQWRFQPKPGFPTAVLTPLVGYEMNVGKVLGVSLEFEGDLTGAVYDLVHRIRGH